MYRLARITALVAVDLHNILPLAVPEVLLQKSNFYNDNITVLKLTYPLNKMTSYTAPACLPRMACFIEDNVASMLTIGRSKFRWETSVLHILQNSQNCFLVTLIFVT